MAMNDKDENFESNSSTIYYNTEPKEPAVEVPNGTAQQDWTEELSIVVIGVVAIVAMIMLKNESIPIVTGLGGGLVGYLTRGFKQRLSKEF